MGYAYYEIARPDQPYGKTMKRGYSVVGYCHKPACRVRVDRGFGYLCYECTWYYCSAHLNYSQFEAECFAGVSSQVCEKCVKLLEKYHFNDLDHVKSECNYCREEELDSGRS